MLLGAREFRSAITPSCSAISAHSAAEQQLGLRHADSDKQATYEFMCEHLQVSFIGMRGTFGILPTSPELYHYGVRKEGITLSKTAR